MTSSRDTIIQILKRDLPYLKKKYGVEKIALFGSYTKGQQKKKSDIDILVDLKKPLGLDFIELAGRLEEKLGKKVDVATFDCYQRSFNNPRYKHIAEDIKKSLIYV
jgi:uncharacterized protein